MAKKKITQKALSVNSKNVIGNYIHFRAQNYLNYGLARTDYNNTGKTIKNSNVRPSANIALHNQHLALQHLTANSLSSQEADRLQDLLNQNSIKNFDNIIDKDVQDAFKTAIQELFRKYNKTGVYEANLGLQDKEDISASLKSNPFSNDATESSLLQEIMKKAEAENVSIPSDWRKQAFSQIKQGGKTVKITLDPLRYGENFMHKTTLESFDNRLKDYMKAWEKAFDQSFNSPAIQSEVDALRQQLIKEAKWISQTIQMISKQADAQGIIRLNQKLPTSSKTIPELFDEINQRRYLLKAIDMSFMIKGFLGEVLTAANAFFIEKNIRKIDVSMLEDLISYIDKQFVERQTKSSTMLNNKKFNQGVMSCMIRTDKEGNKKIGTYSKNKQGVFTASKTDDKQDIVINVPTNLGIEHDTVKMSLKTTTRPKDGKVSLLTGRSMLALIQDYPTFTNHFLNIVPIRKGPEAGNDLIPDTLRNDYMKAVKLTIFLKALLGGVNSYNEKTGSTHNQAVNVFTILNTKGNKKGEYECYSMTDIYNIVQTDIDKYATVSVNGKKKDFGFTQYYNPPGTNEITSANERIAKLLLQLHWANVKVLMSFDAIPPKL